MVCMWYEEGWTIYLKAYKRNIERWDMYEVFEEENCISFGECS